jgi:6-phosphogluconate dehydrogenase
VWFRSQLLPHGRGELARADAMRMEVPAPVIAQSVMQLLESGEADNESGRAVAMMRHGFGGHACGPNKPARAERVLGRDQEISAESPPGGRG